MDNPGKLFGQIAAEAGVTENSAKIAVYLLGMAKDGRTLEYAAESLKLKPDTVRGYARDYIIDFPDYTPHKFARLKGDVEPKYVLDTGHA